MSKKLEFGCQHFFIDIFLKVIFSPFLSFLLAPWHDKGLHCVEQTDWNFISMTLRYGPWSGWNTSLFLCYKILCFGKVTMWVTWIFLFFPPNHAAQTSNWSYQRSSDCKIIWWRLRMKIHTPTAQMWFKINPLELSNSYTKWKFILHTL